MIPKCIKNRQKHEDLENKFNEQLNNGSVWFDGLYKRSIRNNATTFSIDVPTSRTDGFIRKAIVAVGDTGFLYLTYIHSIKTVNIRWSSFTSPTTAIEFDGTTLTFTFSATIYGGISVLFLD